MVWRSFSIEDIWRSFPETVNRLEELEKRYLVGKQGFLGALLEETSSLYAQYPHPSDRISVKTVLLSLAEAAAHLTQALIGYGCYLEAQEVANLAYELSRLCRDREHSEEAWLLYIKAKVYGIRNEEFELEQIRSSLNRLLHRSTGDLSLLKPSQRRNQVHLMQQTAQVLWRIFIYRKDELLEAGNSEKLHQFLHQNLLPAWNMKLLNPELRDQVAFRKYIREVMPAVVENDLDNGSLYRSLSDWVSPDQIVTIPTGTGNQLQAAVEVVQPIANEQESMLIRRYEQVFKIKYPYRKGLKLNDSMAEQIANGRRAFLEGEIETAKGIFTELFQNNPTQPFFKEWYALIRGEMGDHVHADRLLSQVITVRQANFITVWNLAYYKYKQGLKQECLNLLATEHWMNLNNTREEYSAVAIGLALELKELDIALQVLRAPTMISYLPLALSLSLKTNQNDLAKEFFAILLRELQPESWYEQGIVPLDDERRVSTERLKSAFSFFVSQGLEEAGIKYFKNRLHYEPHYYANWGFLGNLYENLGQIDRAFRAYARKAECTLHSKTRYAIKQQVYIDLLNFGLRHHRDDLLQKALWWASRAGLDEEVLQRFRRVERQEPARSEPRRRIASEFTETAKSPRIVSSPQPRSASPKEIPSLEIEVLNTSIPVEVDISSIIIRFRNQGTALPRFKAGLITYGDGWNPVHHEPFQIPFLPRAATTVYRFPIRKGANAFSAEFELQISAEPESNRGWSQVVSIVLPVEEFAHTNRTLQLPSIFPDSTDSVAIERQVFQKLINGLLQLLGQMPIILTAPDGTGKSAVLHELAKSVSDRFEILYIHFEPLPASETTRFQAAMDSIQQILEKHQLTLEADLSWLLPSRRLIELIRYINTKLPGKLVVLWDDVLKTFEEAECPKVATDSKPDFNYLDLLDELSDMLENRFVVCFSTWDFTINTYRHPFFKKAKKFQIPFLDELQTKDLLRTLTQQAGYIFPDETIERMWRLSDGYLKFLEGLCDELVTSILSKELRIVAAPQDIDRAGNFLINKSGWFEARWQPGYLSKQEISICRAIIETQRKPGFGVASEEVAQRSGVPEPKFTQLVKRLINSLRILLYDEQNDVLTFRGMLLDWFLEQDRATFTVREQWKPPVQAAPQLKPTAQACDESEQKVALFIDHENLYLSLRDNGIGDDTMNQQRWLLTVARRIRKKAEQLGPLAVQPIVVANWDRPPFRYHMRAYRNAGYDVRIPPTSKERSADFELYDEIHAVLAQHPEVRTFVLVSADRDFAQVALRIRDRYQKQMKIWAVAGPSLSDIYKDLLGDELEILNEYLFSDDQNHSNNHHAF